MATTNKLIPIIAAAGVAIVGVVVYKQFTGSGAVKPGAEMTAVPDPDLPRTAGADADTPAETLRMVATSNAELRADVARVIQRNNELIEEQKRLQTRLGGGEAGVSAAQTAPPPASAASAASAPAPAQRSAFDSAIDTAAEAADALSRGFPSHTVVTARPGAATPGAARPREVSDELHPAFEGAPGEVRYSLMPPMGYAVATEAARGGSGATGVTMTRFVRTTQPEGVQIGATAATGPAGQAAQAAAQQRKEDIPFFTIPENATLAGVTAMTSIIGRVPIDGRVNDPMQFKAVIGRDNLAANGFELPPDIAGMIVTGVAIGDMALSCSEGKIRSATFVFNDGAIRTVSSRRASGGIGGGGSITSGGGSSTGTDLGFISDLHGNPCIPGKFVTNAPAYLTDIIGLSALGVAGQAYADAQRTTRTNYDGSTNSTVTGSVGDYALGQAVAGGTNEVTKWMLQRLKNSFDAVVTPSGQQLVVHLDREIRIDKAQNPRRLIHRQQSGTQIARGAHHGLE